MKFIKNLMNFIIHISNNYIIKIYKFYIIISLLFCLPTINQKKIFYHLIIDAGSSGTRFCPYKIDYSTQKCILKELKEDCYIVPAKNGMANLSKEEINNVLDKGFSQIFSNYKKIDYISLLGTGGFRKLTQEEKKKKFESITEYFFKIPITSNIKFISGEEESYLAWKSIEVFYNSKSHNILETGGATIQIGIKSEKFFSISLPFGMNSTYENLLENNEFKEKCKYGLKISPEQYEFCKNFIKEKIFNNQELIQFKDKYKNYLKINKTYSSGTPWYTIFTLTNANQLTSTILENKGKEFCNKTKEELFEYNLKEKYYDKLCYLFYYHSAQLESLEIPILYKGIESWTIGASISKIAIPYCGE